VLAAALISLTATQFVAFALLSVILDRVVGTSFSNASEGGSALLYEHLFWFYSHPAVYIMILPAFGLVLEILAHFSRKPVFAYKWVVGSFFIIVFLSFIVWAHHLFTSGMHEGLHLPFMVTTELISIPTGMVFLSGLGTIWRGRLSLRTPMLFALIFFFNFAIGGLTGIHLADVPTDLYLQDTYFVVAHFHYTIMGGMLFAFIAGVYYWFPKITGHMYNETLGKIHFVWFSVFYSLTFLTMFWVGLQGMNRRVADYFPGTYELNGLISIFSFILSASFVLMLYNIVVSWIKGPKAPDNPWNALTLEWQTSSPPPLENFATEPTVVGSPYPYGSQDAVHSVTSSSENQH
jgi:cytochrome c oxidase subunit 1